MKLYEAKFEVAAGEEKGLVKLLGLRLEREYTDIDTYLLSEGAETLKIKTLKDDCIYYKIVLVNDIFEITGENISEDNKQKILVKTPVARELNRTKRVFLWDKFKVKCAFDYIKELAPRVFVEVYANQRKPVEDAQKYLKRAGFNKIVRVAYDKIK